jgi:hypothetical protein
MSDLEPSPWNRLLTFWQSETARELERMDSLLQGRQVIRTATIINLEYRELSRLARQLGQFDREVRRAASILDPIRASGVEGIFVAGKSRNDLADMFIQKLRRGESSLPTPAPTAYGGFRVVDASAGSMELVVEAYRYLEELLTSRPAQAFGIFLSIVQTFGGIRLWINLRSDPLKRINSRNALQILREFGNHPERAAEDTQPEIEIPFYGRESRAHRAPSGTLWTPHGTRVVGRRITYIRVNGDGTQDIIQVEG